MDTLRIGRKATLLLFAALAVGISSETVLAQGEQPEDEIVVTGSRIVRRDFSSQTPIVTVDAEALTQRTNIGLEAGLNQMPQFTPAGTQAQTQPCLHAVSASHRRTGCGDPRPTQPGPQPHARAARWPARAARERRARRRPQHHPFRGDRPSRGHHRRSRGGVRRRRDCRRRQFHSQERFRRRAVQRPDRGQRRRRRQ